MPPSGCADHRGGEACGAGQAPHASRPGGVVAWLPPLAVVLAVAFAPAPVSAQVTTRLAVVLAGQRGGTTAADLQTLRTAARSSDADTARLAIRALGRVSRAGVLPDLLAALRHPQADARAEAADALAQATRALKTPDAGLTGLSAIQSALVTRLGVDAESSVRGAIAESLARLPYPDVAGARRAADAILALAVKGTTALDRLGVAKALEALIRLHYQPPKVVDADVLAVLRQFIDHAGQAQLTLRDERVRRLALQALMNAGPVDPGLLETAAADPDAQVRRLALTAAAAAPTSRLSLTTDGTLDASPMVRIAALRTVSRRDPPLGCDSALRAVSDSDLSVALVALDLLAACGDSPLAVTYLERTAGDDRDIAVVRGWHRPAHAIVALATAAPERAAALLPAHAHAPIWQVRMYAARAAAVLADRETLAQLAADADDNVREAAVDGLRQKVGHDADALYLAQLNRSGNQILRAAAVALESTPGRAEAVEALRAALDRLVKAGRDNSHDARAAITRTLVSLGETVTAPPPAARQPDPSLTAANLRRLASPRARLTIRDVGRIDLALFTAQAPATVLRFARLASAGYYNGLSFHRIVPNFVIQGGSPGANEYIGDSPFMHDELGVWPHVRGTVGISTRGRDTGDAQFFVNLVDNPRLDHEYTVFGQILTGADVLDRILEGDIIESIEILP